MNFRGSVFIKIFKHNPTPISGRGRYPSFPSSKPAINLHLLTSFFRRDFFPNTVSFSFGNIYADFPNWMVSLVRKVGSRVFRSENSLFSLCSRVLFILKICRFCRALWDNLSTDTYLSEAKWKILVVFAKVIFFTFESVYILGNANEIFIHLWMYFRQFFSNIEGVKKSLNMLDGWHWISVE